MSLIHDALKKAQAPSPDAAKTEFPQFLQDVPDGEGKPKLNVRTIVLAIILVGTIGFLVYQKFSPEKPPKPAAAVADKSAATTVEDEKSRQAEVSRLKEEAIKAFRQNNLDDAWVRLSTASQIEPRDAQLWNNMGLVSKRKGDIAKAREFYEKALQIKPDYPECLNNLAILDMDEGNFELAQERLVKALSLNPQYADAAFHLAVVAEEREDIRLAVSFYKKFLSLAKDGEPQLLEDVRRHVATIESE